MRRWGRAAALTIGGVLILFGLLVQFRPNLAAKTLGVLLGPLREPGAGPILLGVALVVSSLFDGRYRARSAASPGPGWERTGETFRDEESGKWVQVWYHPTSGERCYVRLDSAA